VAGSHAAGWPAQWLALVAMAFSQLCAAISAEAVPLLCGYWLAGVWLTMQCQPMPVNKCVW